MTAASESLLAPYLVTSRGKLGGNGGQQVVVEAELLIYLP